MIQAGGTRQEGPERGAVRELRAQECARRTTARALHS